MQTLGGGAAGVSQLAESLQLEYTQLSLPGMASGDARCQQIAAIPTP